MILSEIRKPVMISWVKYWSSWLHSASSKVSLKSQLIWIVAVLCFAALCRINKVLSQLNDFSKKHLHISSNLLGVISKLSAYSKVIIMSSALNPIVREFLNGPSGPLNSCRAMKNNKNQNLWKLITLKSTAFFNDKRINKLM